MKPLYVTCSRLNKLLSKHVLFRQLSSLGSLLRTSMFGCSLSDSVLSLYHKENSIFKASSTISFRMSKNVYALFSNQASSLPVLLLQPHQASLAVPKMAPTSLHIHLVPSTPRPPLLHPRALFLRIKPTKKP